MRILEPEYEGISTGGTRVLVPGYEGISADIHIQIVLWIFTLYPR